MLRLRPYKSCDAVRIVSWIKSEKSFYQWSAGKLGEYPLTADILKGYYERYADSDFLFAMTAFDESGSVGHLMMRFLDEEKQNLRFGFVVVDDEKRGKGYGRELISLALKYAFEILQVSKVTIGVFENNPSAYRCYCAAGFEDAPAEKAECYHFLGEDWKCLELEIGKWKYKPLIK